MSAILAPLPPTLLPKSKTQWRREGRGLRADALPTSQRIIHGKQVALYAEDQTTRHSPYTIARNYLIDLFVGYPDRFGFTEHRTDNVRTVMADDLVGSVSRVVERGFNYEACAKGIRFGHRVAESFHVAAGEKTDWFVIDLDNHTPTIESTKAHLGLLEQLQAALPKLDKLVGIKSTFFQYRQIEPTGIQLWVVLKRNWNRTRLHQLVHEFLIGFGPELNRQLLDSGLAGLDSIEIQPTTHLISMVGCYGKEVFTTDRLRIKEKRFDCIGLYDHIRNGRRAGNVLPRYSALVYVREMESRPVISTPIPAPHSADSPRLSWSDLKQIALNGVTQPDLLHDRFLEPLAQALLLREYFSHPAKEQLTYTALRDWIMQKHNNRVSRIQRGQEQLVERQIRSTIKGVLKKTPAGIAAHYEEMRSRDSRFPHRMELLVPLMQAKRNPGPLLEIDCKAGVSSSTSHTQVIASQPLPKPKALSKNIRNRIAAYCKAVVRKGTMASRLGRFMRLFIAEIGANGQKCINEGRLHQFAGKKPGSDPTYLRAWKKHLVTAGIVKTGWHKFIVRNHQSSKYELTDWVVKELGGTPRVPAQAPNEPLEGRTGQDVTHLPSWLAEAVERPMVQ